MKRLLSMLIVLGLVGTAQAQETPELCTRVSNLAKDIMEKRQVNYDIMLLINTMNNELFDQIELLNVMQAMIDMAYSQALATSNDARNQQVEEFTKYWTQRCLADAQE